MQAALTIVEPIRDDWAVPFGVHRERTGIRETAAGFEFDTPVRFNTDSLLVNLSNFAAGEIPSIPIVEIAL